MKNTTILVLIAVALLAAGVFLFSQENSMTGNLINSKPGTINIEPQKVVISQKGANYYPQTITVKSGQPVEISLDDSVQGCLRSFTIKDFGIAKYLPTPEDKITFTPDKKGTYNFACSMGMGYGKLIVE